MPNVNRKILGFSGFVCSMLFCIAGAIPGSAAPSTCSVDKDEPPLVVKVPCQYRVSEFAFEATSGAAHKPLDIELVATFHGPGRATYTVPGFWDGGRTWKVRFTPDRPGRWTFNTVATRLDNSAPVSGLDHQSGSFTAQAASGDNALFRHGGILKVSSDHRYLTYTDGTAFYWLGDTWWYCPSDLVPIDGASKPGIPSMYKLCIATRQRQGFTVVHWAFLDRIRGKSAFADFQRTRTVDPDYWRTVDRYVAVANDAGIVPVIALGWAGRPLPLEQWKIVWRYVVARYGASSVTWLICGEYNVRGVPDEKIAQTLKLGEFIKAIDPWHRAMTVHPWYYVGDRHQAWKESWYDFIMFQGGHGEKPPPTDIYLKACRSQPRRPVLEGECAYEGIHRFKAADVRNRAWRAFMAGCFGYTYGSQGLWYPTQNAQDQRTKEWGKPTPWWLALERPGAEQLGQMRKILERTAWQKLEPRPEATVLTTTLAKRNTAHVSTVADLTARFDSAKSANALWCKKILHQWTGLPLVDIELHPKNAGPATLRWPAISLPRVAPTESLYLVLALGMDDAANLSDPKHPSDGVTYAVVVNGMTCVRTHRKSKQWEYHAVDLTRFAGQSVTVKLMTEAGKNSAWDHARFRMPMIVRADRSNKRPYEDLYTLMLSEPVLVKAAGNDVFLVYFPQVATGPHPTVALRKLPHDTTYAASWQDPRSGAVHQLSSLRAANTGPTSLPVPPDRRDWVLLLTRMPQNQ